MEQIQNEFTEVVESPEVRKQKQMNDLCNKICYAFRMETPTNYEINGRVYETTNIPGSVISIASSLRKLTEDAYNKTL